MKKKVLVVGLVAVLVVSVLSAAAFGFGRCKVGPLHDWVYGPPYAAIGSSTTIWF